MSPLLDQYGKPFKAAEYNRLTVNLPSIRRPSAEELAHGTLRTIRARSRYIARNHAHANGAIRHIARRVCGAGLRIQGRIRGEGRYLRDENWALEYLWEQRCRYGLTTNGLRGVRFWLLCVLHYLIDGEVFLVKSENRARPGITSEWQIVTGDMLTDSCDAPSLKGVAPGNIVELGIEMTPEGRVVAYHFTEETKGSGGLGTVQTVRVDAYRVIHWANIEYSDAPRGLPILTPVVLNLADLAEFFSAVLTQAWAQASIVAFIKTAMAAERQETRGRIGVRPGADEAPTGQPQRWRQAMTPGTMEFLLPDEEMQFADPKAPSGTIDPFTQVLLRAIAAGIGISYETLARDYTRTNYSSGRQTENEDKLTFQELNLLMDQEIVYPVWADHVDHVYTINRLRQIPAGIGAEGQGAEGIYAHVVQHPVKDHADPVKDVTADVMELEARIASPQEVCAKRGKDFFEVVDEIAEAEAYMRERGVTSAQVAEALAKQAGQDGQSKPSQARRLAEVLSVADPDMGVAAHG